MQKQAKDLWVLVAMVGVAVLNFILFGLNHIPSWKDAASYSAYAANLALGNGYFADEAASAAWREPGYPFFVAMFYKLFGIENVLAVCFVQAILLGLLGFIIYKIFERAEYWRYGLVAGICVSGLPFYGFYTHEILSEFLFAFFLGVIFFICAHILAVRGSCSWYWYAFLGAACGYASLVRFQFVFFLPFIILVFFVCTRAKPAHLWRNIAIAIITMISILSLWALYVQQNTGVFAVTEGRQSEMLYIRGERAKLSYGQLTQYLHDWIWRSISGGEGTKLLYDYEFKNLYKQYHLKATSPETTEQVKRENIAAILSHPGHFLYGSFIEAIKLVYIEHDYSDSTNRYFRAGLYVLIYGFFLFGIIQLLRFRKAALSGLGALALLMIAYNFLVLTMLDTIPRYNTPYLMFYIVVGFIGLILYNEHRRDITTSRKPGKNTK